MYFRHQVVPYNGKLERKIRTEAAKAAQMRNTKEKATGQELLMQMKNISIHVFNLVELMELWLKLFAKMTLILDCVFTHTDGLKRK